MPCASAPRNAARRRSKRSTAWEASRRHAWQRCHVVPRRRHSETGRGRVQQQGPDVGLSEARTGAAHPSPGLSPTVPAGGHVRVPEGRGDDVPRSAIFCRLRGHPPLRSLGARTVGQRCWRQVPDRPEAARAPRGGAGSPEAGEPREIGDDPRAGALGSLATPAPRDELKPGTCGERVRGPVQLRTPNMERRTLKSVRRSEFDVRPVHGRFPRSCAPA